MALSALMGRRNQAWSWTTLFALLLNLTVPLAVVTPAAAASPAANLDQCANGAAGSIVIACAGSGSGNDGWVNGNVGASKAHYAEGQGLPYRMRFSNLGTGSQTVVIEWDITKGGLHALDYLVSYDFSPNSAGNNPCSGVTGTFCGPGTPPGPTDTRAIPVDAAAPPAHQAAGVFSMWGATINSVDLYSPTAVSFSGDQSRQIAITFTPSQGVTNPVLAWAGHIASQVDWGIGTGAGAISGSPYHTRLISLNGSGGNQDRSLAASAVATSYIETVKVTDPANNTTAFGFNVGGGSGTGFVPEGFDLNGVTTNGVNRHLTGPLYAASYTDTETPLSSWALQSLNCPTALNGSSATYSGSTANITLKPGDTLVCTFTNKLQQPALSLSKTASPTTYSTLGQVISYSYVVTNTGNVTLAGPVTVTDDKATVSCPAGGLAPGASTTCTASYTITQADLDGGSVTNHATAHANGTDSNPDQATVNALSPSLTVTKAANPVGPVNAGDKIGFDISVSNSSTAGTATNVQISDQLPAGLNWSINPSISGLSISTGGLLSGNLGNLAPGANVIIHVEATTSSANCGPVTNLSATATPGNGSAASSGSASVTVNCPDVTVVKTADSATVKAGDTAAFTIVVSNIGSGTAKNATVSDQLPAGITWAINPAVTGCSISSGVLNCSLGDLAAGASVTIHISGVPSSVNCGTLTNTATISAANEPANATGNNSSTAVITVQCPVNVSGSYPTATTCQQFIGNTVQPQENGQYAVKQSKISQTNPGVIFYYSRWTPLNSTASIDQLIEGTNGSIAGFGTTMTVQSVTLYKAADCSAAPGTVALQSVSFVDSQWGTQTDKNGIRLTGLQVNLEYVVGVKYSVSSLTGATAPTPTTGSYPNIVFQFQTRDNTSAVVAKDANGFNLTKK
jgi:uncharacterized repeat protein (TIGR01451 family)